MSILVLTFFNNKGVGKTLSIYHVDSMLSKRDRPVIIVDLNPHARFKGMNYATRRLN